MMTSFVHDSSFFVRFFFNKSLQTKSVDVKLPLYNLEFETHFFAQDAIVTTKTYVQIWSKMST